ncbi:MAG: membrane protein [Candidatus Nitrosocaldaceae archaeon]|nr:MAG: membrane protein [Candidatus Nitrosocaldaceae archaeon]
MNRIEQVALDASNDEYLDYNMYKTLSNAFFTPNRLRATLEVMAMQEYKHYQFWSKFTNNKPRISNTKILLMKFLALIMGITFVIKILEKHEEKVIENYKSIMHMLDEAKRKELEKIILDEEKHEEALLASLGEERIKYLGFTVLGLSDALIEIAGIHAGTLGVYTNTFNAGLAGLIAGVAASIAMASAAYNQAKTGGIGKPVVASTYTGIAYIITALLLALPYFIIHDILEALIISLVISIAILAYIALYSHVLHNRNFFRELGETSAIIFGATLALYVFGGLVGEYLGITPNI